MSYHTLTDLYCLYATFELNLLMTVSFYSNGTSMVTLVIPPKEKIEQSLSFLNNEYAQAANIKSK